VLSGKVTTSDGKTREIYGNAWMEHQWGNFRGFDNEHSRYSWAWGRLDNGKDQG
jgi:predicted secreted hydrolase